MDNEKNINTYNQAGQLKIAEDVMAIIAGLAISDQEGVYATERSSGKKNHGKGIRIRMEGTEAICDLDLVICYGVKIPAFAKDVQSKGKSAVEKMTGITVKEMNLNIVCIKHQLK